ncbi:helix-turn-helix transcriptional regulator [Streptomyces spectabilis]|uniref:DNA-binding NarL/FixJ family response regulator n=1 Tax=Streptomyces spectabilis TaxID=68270 RepID=A0A7W8B264_STRST|nr:hypothetical protein [Streptomyces spectabilis]MBB5108999.1 DNA-binding NarL/FixJ family response regulator [Streptomyces spectabilis]GGV50584.1 hypothetical protein GCM10010245_79730 [Streptomyces spectabilis]
MTTTSPSGEAPLAELTPDQQRVADAYLHTPSATRVARDTGLSAPTVHKHLRSICRAYGLTAPQPTRSNLLHALLSHSERPAAPGHPAPALEPADCRLIRAVAEQSTPQTIAAAALLHPKHVEERIKHLQRKMGVSNRGEIVRRAHAWHLLGPFTPAASSAPSTHAAPLYSDLATFAEERILDAARQAWPDHEASILTAIPASTGIVRTVQAGPYTVVAKYDFLGAPMAELLLGLHGSWDTIQHQIAAYQQSPDTRARIQQRELRLLAQARPGLCPPAWHSQGTLFTTLTCTTTLSDLFKTNPPLAIVCMARAVKAARTAVTGKLVDASWRSAPSCSLTRALRRFQPSTPWTSQLERAAQQSTCALIDQITSTAAVLLPELERLPFKERPVFGHLQPDHIGYPEQTQEPLLLSPALHHSVHGADLARLISRTNLDFLTCPPHYAATMLPLLKHLVTEHIAAVPRPQQEERLRTLLQLWLADTLTATASSLMAPRDMPQPQQARSIAAHPDRVQRLLHELHAALDSPDPRKAWLSVLPHLPL